MLVDSALRRAGGLLRRFVRREDGALTWFGLYIFATMCVMGGIALDVAYLMAARTQLQVAADIAAHTALYVRDTAGKDVAKDAAINMAQDAMPVLFYGNVITADDIKFGTYDADTRTFTVDDNSKEAVRIEAFRISERANTIASFLMRFIGKDQWDMVVPSVFETFRPTCMREGFVAEGVVDIQSNNLYTNGFCIHSNDHVSVNSNNLWEEGTIVSMPSLSDLELPRSGYETNDGLENALRTGRYRMRILNKMDAIVAGMTDSGSEYYRDFLISPTKNPVAWKNKMTPADFQSKRVNEIVCSGKNVTLEAAVYTEIVIIGRGCNFNLQNGVHLKKMTLITTSTNDRSVDAPQNLILGVKDQCDQGVGAEVLTFGGFRVAASLEMYGSQVIAHGPIEFAANADGIKGASMVSGSTISGTSNMNFGFCGGGMKNIFEAAYFRMRA